MENLSRLFQKPKRKKKHRKRLSFITQFQIEFLLQFTSYRKMLGKMPEYIYLNPVTLFIFDCIIKNHYFFALAAWPAHISWLLFWIFITSSVFYSLLSFIIEFLRRVLTISKLQPIPTAIHPINLAESFNKSRYHLSIGLIWGQCQS